VLSTTESPLDPLKAHQAIRDSGWKARIVPAFRPDSVVDPEFKGFAGLVAKLGEHERRGQLDMGGYLNALMKARARFKALGCTSTDHGHPTAQTADLPRRPRRRAVQQSDCGQSGRGEQELFRAQMLTEMARMSVEDGLVMQIHPGSVRNHNRLSMSGMGATWARYSRADELCGRAAAAAGPLRQRTNLTIILFTLDETTSAANWRRWPGIIRACVWDRRGGFMTVLRDDALPRAGHGDGRVL
jgi:glucuronate isomerase